MAKYNGWVLTDVLLFTHLVHLPNQMGSPKHLLIFGESGGTCRTMTHASFFATMLPNASVKTNSMNIRFA